MLGKSDLDPVFQSARLDFRSLNPIDAEKLFALHALPEVTRFLGIPSWTRIDDSMNYIYANARSYKKHGFGRWVVSEKSGEDFIGIAGLIVDPYEGFIDLGYRFFPRFWGQNYATESAVAVLKYGFKELKLNEIEARVALENTASERVLQKAGLTLKGQTTCMGLPVRAYEIKKEIWHSRGELSPQ